VGATTDSSQFRQIRLQQVERIKSTDPVTYEALRALEEALNEHGKVLNVAVGQNDPVVVPPRGYQPLGLVDFNPDDHIGSVPPPATSEDPIVGLPPNPRTHPIRMQIIRLSERARITRVVPPRGDVGQVYTIVAPLAAEFTDLPPSSGATEAIEPVQDSVDPRIWTLPDPAPLSWVASSIRFYLEGVRLRSSLLTVGGTGNRTVTLDPSVIVDLGDFIEGEGRKA